MLLINDMYVNSVLYKLNKYYFELSCKEVITSWDKKKIYINGDVTYQKKNCYLNGVVTL